MDTARLSIFARLPVPGEAKTRLIPAVGAEGAAKVYDALLRHTLDAARKSALDFEIRVTGGEPDAFRERFGADLAVVRQGDGDLGARMAKVASPCLMIGSDCPGLTAPLLQAAAAALEKLPAVIGPATDGGYYLIGLREPMPWLFDNMTWSTSDVLAQTLSRLDAKGVYSAMLSELADIDTPEDLADWPEFQ